MATLAELNTVYVEVLNNVTNIQNSDFDSAAPADINAVSVVSTATAKMVTAGSISAVSITPFTDVTFSTVSTTDEVTNESLNRNATSLAADINSKMSAFTSSISLSVNGLKSDVASSINSLTTDLNTKLASIKSEQDTQVSAINTQLGSLVTDLNAQIAEVRVAEAQQSTDIATKLNLLTGELTANIVKVKNIADNAQQKIAALDSVYGTDSAIASQVSNVNAFIDTLRVADLDFITAVNGTIDEVNGLKRVQTKEIVVAAGSGIYSFSTLAEGFGEFINSSDYTVSVEEINNFKVRASVENKTKDGFDIRVISHGVHFVPQPIDCAVTPIKVTVKVEANKSNPLTFNVDTLNASFITNGAGTDINVVGAMVLSASTANVAVDSTVNVSALSASGVVTAVSADTGIATVSVNNSTITVTGVAAGTVIVTVTDGSGTTRTIVVTVA